MPQQRPAAFLAPPPFPPARASAAQQPQQPQQQSRRRAMRVTASQQQQPAAPRAMAARVCRVCKHKFDPAQNGPRACRHHPAMYSGRLLRVTPTETSGLAFFYDCCGATDPNAPGCTTARHLTYDDDDDE